MDGLAMGGGVDRWVGAGSVLTCLTMAKGGYVMVENMFCNGVCSETKSSEVTQLELQDLSAAVEVGLCICSRLPGKLDNQTDQTDVTRVLQIYV